jgi:hypothetical protein
LQTPVIPIQKTITKGLHNIRVDLLNVPITETVTRQSPTPPSESTIDVNFTFFGNGGAGYTHNYKITELGIDIFKPSKTGLNQNIIAKAESGKVYEVEFYNNGSPGGTITQKTDYQYHQHHLHHLHQTHQFKLKKFLIL